MSVAFTTAGSNFRVALYNGTPSNLLSESSSIAVYQSEYNSNTISTPVSVSTDYYLAMQVSSSTSHVYFDSVSNSEKYKSWTYGAFQNPISGLITYNYRIAIYCTYTPSGGTPDISVSPTSYDFGTVAVSSTPYTATNYFTLTNSSTIQTDQTISVTTATWSGGVTWTHSDTATAGVNTAGLLANRNGSWGSGDVIVKYASPNYIYENCPATTSYYFGLKLIAPTSFSYGVQKQIVVRITAAANPGEGWALGYATIGMLEGEAQASIGIEATPLTVGFSE